MFAGTPGATTIIDSFDLHNSNYSATASQFIGTYESGGLLDPANHNVIAFTTRFFSLLSIMGSLAIILSHLFWTNPWATSNRIIILLSISDLLASIGMVFGRTFVELRNKNDSNWLLCDGQAMLIQAGHLSSAMWTVSVALNALVTMFILVHSKNKTTDPTEDVAGCMGGDMTLSRAYLQPKVVESRIGNVSTLLEQISHSGVYLEDFLL
ncbi:hypothetical protein HK102_012712, partial [Quaeritorhiza haematococci]